MLKFGNKEFRNLEEQVLENQRQIVHLLEANSLLVGAGVRVVGHEDRVENLPDPATYDGSYGDAYTVGEQAPFTLHVFTRPVASVGETVPFWFSIGQFPLPGPQGLQGVQGERGLPGQSSKITSSQSNPTSTIGYNVNDCHLNTTDGSFFQLKSTGWERIASLKGAQGLQGVPGPKGDTGIGIQGERGPQGEPGQSFIIGDDLTSTDQLPTPTQEYRNVAYVIDAPTPENPNEKDLYMIIGAEDAPDSALEWHNFGAFTGIRGERGERGEQGIQGIQGIPGSAPELEIQTTTDIGQVGTPSVELIASDDPGRYSLAFHQLKGEKGDKGDSGGGNKIDISTNAASMARMFRIEGDTSDISFLTRQIYQSNTSSTLSDRNYIYNAIITKQESLDIIFALSITNCCGLTYEGNILAHFEPQPISHTTIWSYNSYYSNYITISNTLTSLTFRMILYVDTASNYCAASIDIAEFKYTSSIKLRSAATDTSANVKQMYNVLTNTIANHGSYGAILTLDNTFRIDVGNWMLIKFTAKYGGTYMTPTYNIGGVNMYFTLTSTGLSRVDVA